MNDYMSNYMNNYTAMWWWHQHINKQKRQKKEDELYIKQQTKRIRLLAKRRLYGLVKEKRVSSKDMKVCLKIITRLKLTRLTDFLYLLRPLRLTRTTLANSIRILYKTNTIMRNGRGFMLNRGLMTSYI